MLLLITTRWYERVENDIVSFAGLIHPYLLFQAHSNNYYEQFEHLQCLE